MAHQVVSNDANPSRGDNCERIISPSRGTLGDYGWPASELYVDGGGDTPEESKRAATRFLHKHDKWGACL